MLAPPAFDDAPNGLDQLLQNLLFESVVGEDALLPPPPPPTAANGGANGGHAGRPTRRRCSGS